jgi:hypothetical protein
MTYLVDHAAAPGDAIIYSMSLSATGNPLSWTITTYLGRDSSGISLEKRSGVVPSSAECVKTYTDAVKDRQPQDMVVTSTVLTCDSYAASPERQTFRLPPPPTSFATTIPAVPLFVPRLTVGLRADGDSSVRVSIQR